MSFLKHLLRIPHRSEGNALTDKAVAFELSKAYRAVFLGDDGKPHHFAEIVLADLCKQGGVISSVVARDKEGHVSVEDALINEGKRIVVIGLLRRIYKRVSLGEGLSPEEEEMIAKTLIQEIEYT